jgi:hypothetical protein
MVKLHPNQYVYFNYLIGDLPGAYGKYETAYYGNSYAEAVKKLVQYVKQELPTKKKDKYFIKTNGASI